MATSNIAAVIKDANASLVSVAKAHQFQVWDPAMPANTTLLAAMSNYARPALTITQTGSVGIGTTLPTVALDVAGTVTATAFIGDGSQLTGIAPGNPWSDVGNDTYTMRQFVGIGTANAHLLGASFSIYSTSNGAADLVRINETQSGLTPMIIKNSGNIGFGTTNPRSFLDIFATHPPADMRYPPKPLSSNSTNIVATTYGLGTYVAYASTDNGANLAYRAFAQSTGTFWQSASATYDTSTGVYLGGGGISGYMGEWLRLQSPNIGFTLRSYSITSATSTNQYGAPKTWRLFASKNGSTWTQLDSKTEVTFGSGSTQTFTVNNTEDYTYYSLVINKIQGGGFGIDTAIIDELTFYGYPGPRSALYFNESGMFIPPGIRVGVGSTMPEYDLDIAGNLCAYTYETTSDGSAAAPVYAFNENTGFYRSPSSNIQMGIVINGIDRFTINNNFPSFIGIGTTNPITRLHTVGNVLHMGSVGIGTNAPTNTQLYVQGRTLLTGNVGIGTTNLDSRLSYMLQLSQDSAAKPATSTWTTTSDARLKEDIQPADYALCRHVLSNLDLKYYKWRDDVPVIASIEDRHKLGWIANDVQNIFPKAVRTIPFMYGFTNVLDLNVDQIYAAMYGAIKQLMQEVDELETEWRSLNLS